MAFKGFYDCAIERTKLDNQQWRRTSNELKSNYNLVAPSQQLDMSFYKALFVLFFSLFCFHFSFSLSCISLSVALFIFLSVRRFLAPLWL